jgi:transcriptional regulator with XRE-family HTH domain
MTVEALADKLECSPGYVSMLEHKKRKPSFRILDLYETLSAGLVRLSDFRVVERARRKMRRDHEA